MEKGKEVYWSCVIGPTNKEELPDGADTPLRTTVVEAFKEVTGHRNVIMSSGWGITQERASMINRLTCVDGESDVYKEIKKLLNL